MPRLNGKFASRGKYAEALASGEFIEVDHGIAVDTASITHEEDTTPEETAPVSVEETKTRKPRTSDPITSATVAVRQAKKELDRAKAYWAKTRNVPPTVEEAEAAYDRAVVILQDTLNV